TPQIWGIAWTAPYFHDNSAKTLEDVAEQYAWFFENSATMPRKLTKQDQKDMVAFMKLLEDDDDSDSDSGD
ncbi:MAG: hypothetical protein KJO19_05805, partial [Woeseia sp.]|nr:hypothetical protein [Woeseia sp.]